jgi:glycine cleavage system H protein
LRADPSLANSAPETEGWFFKMKISDASQLDALLDATTYQKFADEN